MLKKLGYKLHTNALPLSLALVVVTVWQVVAPVLPPFLPPPLAIGRALIANGNLLFLNSLVTLGETLAGLILAGLLALPLAFLFDTFIPVKKLIYPALALSQTIPIIALAPFMLMAFGFGLLGKVVMVFVVAMYPLVASLCQALKNSNKKTIELLKSYGAGSFDIFKLVKAPQASVGFFAGLKIASTYALGSAVVAEWLGATRGLGLLLMQSRKSYHYDLMFALVVLMVLLSLLCYFLALCLEKCLLLHKNRE
jgi:ABC-type nitrate/sulfonate/bicarbonate transport system permease component